MLEEVKTQPQVEAAPTVKDLEAEEPLLQENPNRFVLFPLKARRLHLTRFFANVCIVP